MNQGKWKGALQVEAAEEAMAMGIGSHGMGQGRQAVAGRWHWHIRQRGGSKTEEGGEVDEEGGTPTPAVNNDGSGT